MTDGHSTVAAQKTLIVKKQDRIKTFSVSGVTFKMIRIPAGSFMMGSRSNESGRYGDEGPQHRVTLTHNDMYNIPDILHVNTNFSYQNTPKWSFREQYGLFTSSSIAI